MGLKAVVSYLLLILLIKDIVKLLLSLTDRANQRVGSLSVEDWLAHLGEPSSTVYLILNTGNG